MRLIPRVGLVIAAAERDARALAGLRIAVGALFLMLVAFGELAIGISLIFGVGVRAASTCGLIYMLALLFSANYPGPEAVFWQYFGAALNHSGAGALLRRVRVRGAGAGPGR
jgi:uncharacterized membrane protein YphA (DoxX/SURF4 family)